MGQTDRALPGVFIGCVIAIAALTVVGLTGLAVYAWRHIGIDAIALVFVIDILVVIGVVVMLSYGRRD